jgi:hypothetical protein
MLMRDTTLSTCQTARKRRSIVMLTSCSQTIVLHFAEMSQFFPIFSHFFPVFLRFSYALVSHFLFEYQSIGGKKYVKICKIRKSGFFFVNIIFLKVKMDMLFMSFFKKKDRMFTTFFPASFHFTGLD